MDNEKKQFLDEKGVEKLAESLFEKINEMLDQRIITSEEMFVTEDTTGDEE